MNTATPIALGGLETTAVRRDAATARRPRSATPAFWLAWVLPAILLATWQCAATYGWLPAQILPTPAQVFDTLMELLRNGDVAAAMRISLQRIALGFAIGAPLALITGIALGTSARVREYLEPSLRGLFAIPSLGWIPILILVFGVDEALKVLIIAKAVFVPLVINTAQGIRNVPVAYQEAARVMRLRRSTRLFKLTLPASLPTIASGLRLGLSHAFIALVVVEMLAATEGIGYLMVWGRKSFQIDTVIVGMLIVGALGYSLDRTLRALERRLGRWSASHGH